MTWRSRLRRPATARSDLEPNLDPRAYDLSGRVRQRPSVERRCQRLRLELRRSAGAELAVAEPLAWRRRGRLRWQVQTAFTLGGVLPPPAPGALVLAGARLTRARLAADGDEALVVQGVVGHLLVPQVGPHVTQA